MTNEIIIPEPLRAKARELALPDSLASDLLAAYAPFAIAGGDVKQQIKETGILTPEIARSFRLAMVKVRTGSDKKRKELKADSLLRGKAIDGLHAMIELEATSVERAMDEIEKAAERAEAARLAKLREDRLAALRPYVTDPSVYVVEMMTEQAFAELAESSRLAHAAREHARIAAARAEAERIEAARLAAVEAERMRQEELAAARAEAEAMRKKAAEEAEARRIADEQARAERAAEQAKVEAERAAERAKLAKIEAERKAEADRREAEEQTKRNAEEQARIMKEKADAAPDAEKIEALSAAILAIPLPILSQARNAQHDQIVAQRAKFVAWLNGMAQKLRT